ncbi:hybrid sensor histidine kinase/response regulator [Peptostreptococcaceae bacterium AGR-M142]
MTKSIYNKINKTLIIIIIFTLLSTGVLMYYAINMITRKNLELDIELFLDSIAFSVTTMINEGRQADVQRLLEVVGNKAFVEELLIFDYKKNIYASNNVLQKEVVIDEDSYKRLFTGEIHYIKSFENNGSFCMLRPISTNKFDNERRTDVDYGIKILVDKTGHVLEYKEIFFILIIINLFIGFMMMVGASYLFKNFIELPIRKITMFVNRVKIGDYSKDIKYNEDDEFGELARDFNIMEKEIELRNKKLEEAINEAKRANQAKRDFLANMSHEIRTPLNSIIGYTSILEEEECFKNKSEIEIIKNSAKYLLEIVNDILDFSKIEAKKLEFDGVGFDLRKDLNSIIQIYNIKSIEKDINIEISIDENVPYFIFTDQKKLNIIYTNLISNATKYTLKGNIIVELKYKNDKLYSKVIDSGVGISQSKLETIFNPFEQEDKSTTRKFGGTGLGLTITKSFVEFLGGYIKAESKKNIGTEFEFCIDVIALPKIIVPKKINELIRTWIEVDEELEEIIYKFLKNLKKNLKNLKEFIHEKNVIEIEKLSHALKGSSGNLNINEYYILFDEMNNMTRNKTVLSEWEYNKLKGIYDQMEYIYKKMPENIKEEFNVELYTNSEDINIIVAEDIKLNQMLISKFLDKLNVKAKYCFNGRELLDELKNNDYHIILLDIQMPVLSGEEVLKILSDSNENYHIIVMTANVQKEDIDRYYELGCSDYISKPIRKDIFINKIANIINKFQD